MPPVLPADDPTTIARAVAALRRGGLVGLPTETVYGLGADAGDDAAVRSIFAAKGRPPDHPLIVHVAAMAELDRWAAHVPEVALRLAERFWPGPLTLVLRRRPGAGEAVSGGLPTIALRMPAHPVTLAVIHELGGGIAAPSANRFGRVSPTTARDVVVDLGDAVELVVDGGRCALGVESTIVDLTTDPPELLRPGGLDAAALGQALDTDLAPHCGRVRAPGMLHAHYAPTARVEVVETMDAALERAARLETRVGVLGDVGAVEVPRGVDVLDTTGSADEYARRLYALLREADARSLEVVVAVLPPATGIGLAVRDRLRRAANAAKP